MCDPALAHVIRSWLDERALQKDQPAIGMGDHLLIVLADTQQMIHLQGRMPQASYVISTSHLGLGEKENSRQTPRGWHEVAERFGHGHPPGAVFVSRQFTGEILPASAWQSGQDPSDKILTRILRLRGLEPERNLGGDVDTWNRWIYLHGTNHEETLGIASSGGCIRMGNQDIVRLFQETESAPIYCWIGTRAALNR